MAKDIYDRFQGFADSLLKRYTPQGPNCILRQVPTQTKASEPNKPWKTEPFVSFISTQFATRCVFLPDELEDRQLIQLLKGTGTIVGQVNGYMQSQDNFTPNISDIIFRPVNDNDIDLSIPQAQIDLIDDLDDTERWEQWDIANLDTIRPSRTNVIHVIEFKN